MRSKVLLIGCFVAACHGSVESTERREANAVNDESKARRNAAGDGAVQGEAKPTKTSGNDAGEAAHATSDRDVDATRSQTNDGVSDDESSAVNTTAFTTNDGTFAGSGTNATHSEATLASSSESDGMNGDSVVGDTVTEDTDDVTADTSAGTGYDPTSATVPNDESTNPNDETTHVTDDATPDESNETSNTTSAPDDSGTEQPDPSTVAPAIRASLLQADLVESDLLPFVGTLAEADQIAHVPLMRSFEASLDACSSCHATDYAAWTPAKYVSLHMWADIVTQFRFKDGGLFYCDSCHQGQTRFLDRSNPEALEAWMQVNLVDKLERVDGEPHGCESCHGDPPNYDLLNAWSSG